LGKKDVPGRPLIYGTSKEFLEFFGMRDLSALPTLKEFSDLSPELSEVEAQSLPFDAPQESESEETADEA
ncbi:MAG: SMC-Scp complex subunit ScpB, partial [Desulfuromonas sp.]